MVGQDTLKILDVNKFGALLFVGSLKEDSGLVTTIKPDPGNGLKNINFVFGIEGEEMLLVTLMTEVLKQQPQLRKIVGTALASVDSGRLV